MSERMRDVGGRDRGSAFAIDQAHGTMIEAPEANPIRAEHDRADVPKDVCDLLN